MNKEFTSQVWSCFDMLHSILNKHFDTEDVKQDVLHDILISAYESWPGFRGDCKFSTWLYKIAVRKCVDHRIRSRNLKKHEIEFDRRQQLQTDALENWDALHAGLTKLCSAERILLFQYYLYGIPVEVLAAKQGITENAFRVRILRLKNKIQRP